MAPSTGPLRSRPVAVLPLLFALSTATPHGAAAQEEISEDDSSAVRAAAIVARSGVRSVWPGYTGPSEFVVCTEDGGSVMALVQPPPEDVRWSKVRGLPGKRVAVYHSHERLPGLRDVCIDLHYSLQGRSMLAFPQLDSTFSVTDPVAALATVLYHEEFHRFQWNSFRQTNGPDGYAAVEKPVPVPGDVVVSQRFQELAAAERSVLANALRLSDEDSIRRSLASYIRIRRQRRALVPERVRGTEPHEERKEGSAHLAAYQALTAALENSGRSVRELVYQDLVSTPPFSRDRETSSYRHWHIYATGAAIGLLLDRLHVSWRSRLQAGATFFELAQEAAVGGRSSPIGRSPVSERSGISVPGSGFHPVSRVEIGEGVPPEGISPLPPARQSTRPVRTFYGIGAGAQTGEVTRGLRERCAGSVPPPWGSYSSGSEGGGRGEMCGPLLT